MGGLFLQFAASAQTEQVHWTIPSQYWSYVPWSILGGGFRECKDDQGNFQQDNNLCTGPASDVVTLCTLLAPKLGVPKTEDGVSSWLEPVSSRFPDVFIVCALGASNISRTQIYSLRHLPIVAKCGTGKRPPIEKDEINAEEYSSCQYVCPVNFERSRDHFCKPKTCPVPPLTPITDPLALKFEAQNGNAVASEELSDNAKKAWTDLQAAFTKAGETPTMTSAYRPTAYQAHLVEITEKYNKLKPPQFLKDNPLCATVKTSIDAEYKKHGLNGTIAPAGSSVHESGNAFDFKPEKMSLTKAYEIAIKLSPPVGYSYYVLQETNAIHIELKKDK